MIKGRFYRRNLPHLERDSDPLFVTFCTRNRLQLPDPACQLVLDICLREHNHRALIYAAVVMPDHVHMIISKRFDSSKNRTYRLSEIMCSIKGASSHVINNLMNRRGSVWQEESFDHVARSNESLDEKIAYILNNPVRAGLVKRREDYPHHWHFAPPEKL